MRATDPRFESLDRWMDEAEYRQTFTEAALVALPYTETYAQYGMQSSVLLEAMAHGRPVLVSQYLAHLLLHAPAVNTGALFEACLYAVFNVANDDLCHAPSSKVPRMGINDITIALIPISRGHDAPHRRTWRAITRFEKPDNPVIRPGSSCAALGLTGGPWLMALPLHPQVQRHRIFHRRQLGL